MFLTGNFELGVDRGVEGTRKIIPHQVTRQNRIFRSVQKICQNLSTQLFLEKKLDHPCYYPSYTFFMDYNGDVLMCAHDWGKKRILGNLKKKSFLEILH